MINAALQQQEGRFKNTIDELREQVLALSARQPPRPRPSLPDPDKFDGTFDHWETWYPEMKHKLEQDGDALGGTEKAKFWYIIGRLEKKSKSDVAPQITAAESGVFDPQSLFDQLLRLCNDPNAKKKALRKFLKISQYSDQRFNSFLVMFEKFMFRSGANKWPDEARIAILRNALTDKLKRKLDSRDDDDIPDDNYKDFVSTVQSLESGFEGPSGGQQGSGQPQRKLWVPKDAAPDPDAMQLARMRVLQEGREDTEYDDSDLD